MNFNVGSIWRACDGRLMVVISRTNDDWGKNLTCRTIELLIISEFRYVTRNFEELQALEKKGLLKYNGECSRE